MATLTRGTLGRLAAYHSTPVVGVTEAFDATDWTAEGNTPSVSVSSGSLLVAVTATANGRAYGKLTALAVQADAYVQTTATAQTRTGSVPTLLSRYQSTAEFLEFGAASSSQNIIRERVGGTDVQSVLRQPITILTRFHMRTQGTDVSGMPLSGASNMELSGLGLTAAGYVGLGVWNNNGINANGNVTFGEFYATRNARIKVSSSLATGWYFTVLNAAGNVLATSANAAAGEATIDAYTSRLVLPLAVTIQVHEAATGNVLVTETPTETVWPGDEWTFTPSGGYTPPTVVSRLTRGTLGRLAAFARFASQILNVTSVFSSANWTGFSTTGTSTPAVNATGDLTVALNAGSSPRGARYSALALPVDHFVLTSRTLQTTGGFFGSAGRIDGAAPTQNLVFAGMPLGYSGTYGIVEQLAGVQAQNVTGFSSNRTTSAESSHGLWVRDDLADSRQISAGGTGTADAALDLTNLDPATDNEYGGVYFSSSNINTATIRAWAAMRSAVLRVTGPDEGTWQVRLRNAAGTVIYTSASHTGGVVEINTLDEMTVLYASGTPLMAQIEIYEPADATVLRGPETPNEYLWGGDVWAWDNHAPPAPSYPSGRLVHRKAGAQRLLLKR